MEDINHTKLCQICLKESHLYSNVLTEKLEDGIHLVDVINDLLQLDMEYEECYSEFLCIVCYNKISEFRIFKKTAHEGRAYLLFSNGNVENGGAKMELDKTADSEGFVPVQNEVYLASIKIEQDCSDYEDRDPLEVETEEAWHSEEASGHGNDQEFVHAEVEEPEAWPLEETDANENCAEYGDAKMSSGAYMESEDLNYDGAAVSGQEEQEQEMSMMNYLMVEGQEQHDSSEADFTHFLANTTEEQPAEDTEKSLQCQFCDKYFNYISELKRHERRHTGERPFTCQICGKGFSRGDTLKIHETIHSGEKLVQCKLCNKEFRYTSELTAHERTHTGVKPYKCKFCSKNFSRIHHLKQHERSHTGEKPFQCSLCDKGFSRSNILREHERVHTGEKPLKCKYCPKQFSFNSNLKAHESRHKDVKT